MRVIKKIAEKIRDATLALGLFAAAVVISSSLCSQVSSAKVPQLTAEVLGTLSIH